MNKKYLLPFVLLCCGKMAAAQTSDKIEKAFKDPATKERSARADVLRMDKTAIMEKDSTRTGILSARKKKESCKKKP